MIKSITLYHNPNCSKSRAALALLENTSIILKIVPYLSEPLSEHQLTKLKNQLGLISWRGMMRIDDDLYHQLKLDEADEKTLMTMLITHPILMQRPIVQSAQRAIIGRPIENVAAFINEDHG